MITNVKGDGSQDIVRYISKVLQSPDTAPRWMEKIKLEIASLRTIPNHYPLTIEAPWHSEVIHKTPAEKFLVYYWVNKSQKTVWITVVIYGQRDQLQVLRNMPKDVF